MTSFDYPGDPAAGMSGSGGIVHHGLTEDEYRAAFQDMTVRGGFRLLDVCPYPVGYGARYAAIWERSHRHPAQWSDHAVAAASYEDDFDARKADGYRLVRVRPYVLTSGTWYATIWEKSAGLDWRGHHNQFVFQLDEHVERARAAGYRIVEIAAHSELDTEPGSTLRIGLYASVWLKTDGPPWQVMGPVDLAVHQRAAVRLVADGWSLVTQSPFNGDSGTLVLSLWERRGIPLSESAVDLDPAALGAALVDRDRRGLRPVRVGGLARPSGDAAAQGRFAPVWVRTEPAQVVPRLVAEFAKSYGDVSALALAVAKDGRLRFTHGFGITDPIDATPVRPDVTRFRIASLSKPITAAAVFRLADQGRLSLDAQVFDAGGLLTGLGVPLDERASDITVRHLLTHTSGLATNDGNDPMFSHRELTTPGELITTVMRERRLDRDPGAGYAYSNFGYSVLGRVIEHVTDRTYEQHLREDLLAGCGITDMGLAGDRREDRARGEVLYYGDGGGADPYAQPVHRMDAHGGWIASAVDLLRFVARVDGTPDPADLLSAAAVREMATPTYAPGGGEHSGAGWAVDIDGNRSHTGRLAGTATLVVSAADGWSWAVLTNTSHADDDASRDTLAGLDTLMWTIRDRVDHWPDGTTL